MERKKLDADQIEENLKLVIDWRIEDGKLTKDFTFKSYASGVLFAAAAAQQADQLDHHRI